MSKLERQYVQWQAKLGLEKIIYELAELKNNLGSMRLSKETVKRMKRDVTAAATSFCAPTTTTTTMKTKLKYLVILPLMLVGCARFTTTQTDTSYETGEVVRTITTRAAATTLFEAKSSLANFKASQTDKTQNATVGSLVQESQVTNSAAAIGEFLGGVIKAAK